jgi:hypothetical protein
VAIGVPSWVTIGLTTKHQGTETDWFHHEGTETQTPIFTRIVLRASVSLWFKPVDPIQRNGGVASANSPAKEVRRIAWDVSRRDFKLCRFSVSLCSLCELL